MLHFFKKSGRTENEEKTPDEVKEKECMPSSLSSSLPFDIILDEKINDGSEFIDSRSRLSKNLIEIISDKNCICYFVQFLEAKNALSLIKFYLDAENFKTVADFSLNSENSRQNFKKRTKIEETTENLCFVSSEYCDTSTHKSDDVMSKKTKFPECSTKVNAKTDEDNIEIEYSRDAVDSVVVVPELKNLCDLSMRKPLTDDEKSQIFAETNKRNKQHQQQQEIDNVTTESSNASYKFNTSIATDAVRIYKKYLTLNSPYFIDIPATITSNISLALCAQQRQVTEYHDDDKNATIAATTAAASTTAIPDNPSADDSNKSMELESPTSSISSDCFEEAKRYVFERLENEYLNEFLESNFYCKYCLDILTNLPNLQLSDILYNESALFYFMEYLEQERKSTYLEFWMAAINFRKHYCNKCDNNSDGDKENVSNSSGDDTKYTSTNDDNDDTKKEAQTDAMILYEKYFSLQAKNRLKIADNIRCKIEENICSNDIKIISKCFDLSLKLIENYFQRNYFEKFIKSQLFTNYLNELRNKLKDYKLLPPRPSSSSRKLLTPSLSLNKKLFHHHHHQQEQQNHHRGHRKTMSDCTNENTKCLRYNNDSDSCNFISQHNTLLAMESNYKFKSSNSSKTATTTPTADCMQIETKYLTNPDLLWHRNSAGTGGSSGLTFGRVDSLGRYERDFDLMEINDDNKWSFKNAVRKLVNLPEEKVQEEIAWQVAELIVKDITSITLGDNYGNNMNINKDLSNCGRNLEANNNQKDHSSG